jgi:S-adenosylmethionine:tRNA ribosyltransferase-isomerase
VNVTGELDFDIPRANNANRPPESRGAGRHDVRLMVARLGSGEIEHDRFANLGRHVRPGDVLVVNTSGTIPACLDVVTSDGLSLKLHLASRVPGGLWAVELRQPTDDGGTVPGPDLAPQKIHLPGDTVAHLLARSPRTPRLWIAAIEASDGVASLIEEHGAPIRYTPGPSLSMTHYQTTFANQPGSAEMPSAGRPFTPAIVTRLVSLGVAVAPIILHAGLSSYEEGESPGDEWYRVPPATATVVNGLGAAGGRVIAVGTTVVRALETVTDPSGQVQPGEGWTDLVITPERGMRAIDAILTGWHEPRSSHLSLLEALVPRYDLARIYEAALTADYLWHEFGDELLILP